MTTTTTSNREQIVSFLGFTDESFHNTIQSIIRPMEEQFVTALQVPGPKSLPDDYKQAIATIDNALRSERAKLEESLYKVFTKHFEEGDLEAIDAWYKGGMSQQLGELQGVVAQEMEAFEKTLPKDMKQEEAIPLFRQKRDEIYAKHFSAEDLKKLTDFMESPIGQKIAEADLVMMDEIMEANQTWMNTALDPVRGILQGLLGTEAPEPMKQAAEWTPPVETPSVA